jgi:basic membrane lipoprotein Med (substrate-binding protein (PBP1-ABC) superfamily)
LSEGEAKAHTEVTKTRVDVVFPITDGRTELDTAVEKQKSDTIVVSGSDLEAMAKRVAERLSGKKKAPKRRKKK